MSFTINITPQIIELDNISKNNGEPSRKSRLNVSIQKTLTHHYNGRKFLLCFPSFIRENYHYNSNESDLLANNFNKEGKIFDLMALDTFHDFEYNEGYYMITKPTKHTGFIHQLFPQSSFNVECKNNFGFDCFNKHKNYTNDDIDKHYGFLFTKKGSFCLGAFDVVKVIKNINESSFSKVFHSIDTSYGYYAIDKDYCGDLDINELGEIFPYKDSSNFIASLEYKQNTGYIFTIHNYINDKFNLEPIVCKGAPNGIVLGNHQSHYELFYKNISNKNSYNRVDEANNVFQHIHSFERKYQNEGDLVNCIELNKEMECIFWVSFSFSTYETLEGYNFLKDKVSNYIYFIETFEELEQLQNTCCQLNIFILGGMICKSIHTIFNGVYLTYFGVNQNYKHSVIGKLIDKDSDKIQLEIINETDKVNGNWIVFNKNIRMIFVNVSKLDYKVNEYHNSKSIIREISKVAFDYNKIRNKLRVNVNQIKRSVIGGNIIQNELGYYCHFFHRDLIFYRSLEDKKDNKEVFQKIKSVFRINYFNKQFGDFSNIINLNILLSKLKPEEQYLFYHHYIFHTGDKTACLYAVLCGMNTILYQKMDNKYGRIIFMNKNKDYIQNNLLKQSQRIGIELEIINKKFDKQILLLNKNENVYTLNASRHFQIKK